jgi:hypothetical protein
VLWTLPMSLQLCVRTVPVSCAFFCFTTRLHD